MNATGGGGVRCEIRLLGGLAERAGAQRVTVEVSEEATVADLRAAVADQHPVLAPLLARVKVAVDLEVAGEDDPVEAEAEVALLPPVAGGSRPRPTGTPGPLPGPRVRADGRRSLTGLVAPPIDAPSALAAVRGPAVGGTVVFHGSVRDHAPDLAAPVVGLGYSAYPEMAERVLAAIAEELLEERDELLGVALLHAVGELAVGQDTVVVACAAAHRAEAFDACREALEQVKDRVPVFKREVTAGGAHRWVGLEPEA